MAAPITWRSWHGLATPVYIAIRYSSMAMVRAARRFRRAVTDMKRYTFQALVTCDDEKPFRPGCPRFLATLRLAGDDVTDYLNIGGHFDLWLGDIVGDGIV